MLIDNRNTNDYAIWENPRNYSKRWNVFFPLTKETRNPLKMEKAKSKIIFLFNTVSD